MKILCKKCIFKYLKTEIMKGAYEITCPDNNCKLKGIFSLNEIEKVAGSGLFDKHMDFRLDTYLILLIAK